MWTTRTTSPIRLGTTFMGQFLDHDMTFDLTSKLGVRTVRRTRSTRARRPLTLTPSMAGGQARLLSCMSSGGGDTPKFKIDNARTDPRLRFEDVPRHSNGTAIIADPRR